MRYVSDCCHAPIDVIDGAWICHDCKEFCNAVPAQPPPGGAYLPMCVAARFRAAQVIAAYTAATVALRAWTPPGTQTDVVATGAALCVFTSILTTAAAPLAYG